MWLWERRMAEDNTYWSELAISSVYSCYDFHKPKSKDFSFLKEYIHKYRVLHLQIRFSWQKSSSSLVTCLDDST